MIMPERRFMFLWWRFKDNMDWKNVSGIFCYLCYFADISFCVLVKFTKRMPLLFCMFSKGSFLAGIVGKF